MSWTLAGYVTAGVCLATAFYWRRKAQRLQREIDNSDHFNDFRKAMKR